MKRASDATPIGELRLFDTCVTLGALSTDNEALGVDNVLEILDKHDICEALVHNNEARVVYPRERGNIRLLDWVKGCDRLHPVWALDPIGSPDVSSARSMVAAMLEAGVRAARLMMGVAPPFLWVWDSLCTALDERHIPCMLDFAPVRDRTVATTQSTPDELMMNELRSICLAHPELPMVLSNVSGGRGLAWCTLALMREVPNLHIDTSCIIDYWRTAYRELGPERVFFATGMPFYDPSIFVSMIQYADDVALVDKQAMCGGNIRRLMEAVQ
ncbi:MAG: amidohydrolase family protein [Chloroflexi bacterium]|nr:amidohydrolase family protein [Chloroflexota bacterium]